MKTNKELYPRYELAKLLNITYSIKIIDVLNEYNIKPVSIDTHNIEYYRESDVKFLLGTQNEIYEYYQENFVTYDEGKKLGANAYDLTLSNPTELPIIARIKKFYKKKMVYEKNILNKVMEKKALLKKLSYYTTKEVLQLFQVVVTDISKLLKEYKIEPIIIKNKEGNFYRWHKKEIDTLLTKREELYRYYDQNYLTYKELSKLLNVKMISFHVIKKYNLIIEALPSLIKFNRFKNTNVAFSKKSVNDYLNIRNEKHNKKKVTVPKERKNKKVDSIPKEKKNKNMDSVPKDKINKVKKRKELTKENTMINDCIPLLEIRNVLGLSRALAEDVLKEHQIMPKYIIGRVKWYVKSEINKLKEIQQHLYDKFEKDYETFNVLRDGNTPISSISKFTPIPVPKIIKKERFKLLQVVYPKDEIADYLNNRKREELLKDLTKDVTVPFPIFERLVLELNIPFSNEAKYTQKYWFSYVRQTLNRTKGNYHSVKKQIIRFVSITEILANVTRSKEIFSYSAIELNLLLFNGEVFQEYQLTIYSFFNAINNETPFTLIDMSKIKNPHEEKRRKKINSKEVYSPTEFIELLDYVENVELHKQKAIKDILSDLKKYKKYDSAWLYVLLHMNNGWRATDYAYKIPRLDLPEKIKNISDFENVDLDLDDAKYIVVQLSSKLQSLKHSKNQKKNYFFCSDELLYPLANSLIICELRTRLLVPNNRYLIDFMNEKNEMIKSIHDSFFADFKKNFKFGSLKMNRTFIGLTNDVISKKTNRNPLEFSKFIRNHSNLDTTNIYINIPQEHLDRIASQLFDKGYFGYTYDLFSKVLLDESTNQVPDNRIKKSVIIKNVFGDIYKIENLARYINALEQDDEDLLHYFYGHSEKELQEKMLLLNLGQLPAKEEDYQCIYGKCIFLERDCNRCPFAVPHFYALTKIAANMLERLKEYKDIHESSMYYGEKVRISNLLISDLLVLSHAKQKFGEDVLSAFINIQYNDLKEQIRSLPSPYEYITIERG